MSLIDVIWLKQGTSEIVSAFEVEKSTSIYSGILRLEDLARSIPNGASHFYLVVPNHREKEAMAQLSRPAFRSNLTEFDDDHTILRKFTRMPSGCSC